MKDFFKKRNKICKYHTNKDTQSGKAHFIDGVMNLNNKTKDLLWIKYKNQCTKKLK